MEVIERPTLAQVFRRFYPRYRQSSDVSAEQRRAAWSIQACRTPALGEDQWECEQCGKVHTVYHSCGNRHCPTDQARFLFPIKAVSEVFRARLLHRLETLHAEGKLVFPDPLTESRGNSASPQPQERDRSASDVSNASLATSPTLSPPQVEPDSSSIPQPCSPHRALAATVPGTRSTFP